MQMKTRLTRRELAAVALASAAVGRIEGQTARGPQPTADEDFKAAEQRIRDNSTSLAAVPVPMATEPAFQFKV
jgi:hypothetical protein